MGGVERESGVGNRESGIGNRESGIGNRAAVSVLTPYSRFPRATAHRRSATPHVSGTLHDAAPPRMQIASFAPPQP